ncbi:hypothetical protein [Streptomyces griseoruber]|uniref:Uncharacterized protein n=1 Tax=Streptomyces griseoruber TaxID=1943 RepID=A0A101SW81_9ACTN|nr:hypothetical protein [Streptomyces griseoruber]KUN81257.1 hypothetical protein AQJ64_22880 [Streptomyces griseoruber]
MSDAHPTPPADTWRDTLAQAFGEVVGRPLSSFPDVPYGAYYTGNFLAESEMDQEPAWVDRAALAGEEPVRLDHLLLTPPGDCDETVLVFDASRSLFTVDPAAFPAGLAEELAAPGPVHGDLLSGAELGRIAGRHGVDLASAGLPGRAWTVWEARIASGDTLLDALRAATGLHATTGPHDVPAGLGDAADEVGEEAHERVAAVRDDGLRDYLAAFCDPESHDLALSLHAMRDAEDDEETDGTLVIRWEGAVDQYEVTVRRAHG